MNRTQVLNSFTKVIVDQTQAIAKATPNMLFLFIERCVLNQNKGYWLLLDGSFPTFSLFISMKSDLTRILALYAPLIFNDFDSKLMEFKMQMMTQVINKLTFFIISLPYIRQDTQCFVDHVQPSFQKHENHMKVCAQFCWHLDCCKL